MKIKCFKQIILSLLFSTLTIASSLNAQIDPFDVFKQEPQELNQDDQDQNKSATELIYEAYSLQREGRLLDARSKLLKAVKKDPNELKAHMALADYYMQNVGHFRLALKYIKRAEELFYKDYGKPPYSYYYSKIMHGEILGLLSSARLSLDDYNGALAALEEYEGYDYASYWVPASKAWILLKLNRVQDAIKVATEGIQKYPESFGAISNVLGILYSMNGQTKEALEILKLAIENEFTQGSQGNPATPLNNIGEIYNEIFQESKAENSWRRSVSLPDGCEHVLPSLNIGLLAIAQLRFAEAEQVLKDFEGCVAQYPLRNGEEHKALIQLARARIALHLGNAQKAIDELSTAASRQQWFGKIGTTIPDFKAAVYTSYALALRTRNAQYNYEKPATYLGYFEQKYQSLSNSIKANWYERKSRQLLVENLNFFEDLYVRRTDSFLEYPTLGHFLKTFRNKAISQKLIAEMEKDPRAQAKTYYNVYRAQIIGNTLSRQQALLELLKNLRAKEDALIIIQVEQELLWTYSQDSEEYRQLASRLFTKLAPALYNTGLPLPINTFNFDLNSQNILKRHGFLPYNESNLDQKISINENTITFQHLGRTTESVKFKDLDKGLNELVNRIFIKGS